MPEKIIKGEFLNFLTIFTKNYIKTCIQKDITELKLISSWIVNIHLYGLPNRAARFCFTINRLMYALLNQYSFFIIGLLGLPIIWLVVSRFFSWQTSAIFLLLLLVVVGIFQQTRSVNQANVETQSDWEALFTSNKPILLQLYSDY